MFAVKGTAEHVRACCEASLKRLDVDYIDLYIQHRVDASVPIEETVSINLLDSLNCNTTYRFDDHSALIVAKMGELKKLVEEGKIKYIGLSEANVDTIKRAQKVHPITAIQMEYSLWTREIEDEFIPLCRCVFRTQVYDTSLLLSVIYYINFRTESLGLG